MLSAAAGSNFLPKTPQTIPSRLKLSCCQCNTALSYTNTIETLRQASDETLTHIFKSILSWHLSKKGFPSSLAPLAGPLVAATLDVYSAAARKLLPTPAKSHYLFNLRDFARVVQVGRCFCWAHV